jgi:hypothetical protein
MIKYKNLSSSIKTFYGIKFRPGEVHSVPGPINHKKFIRIPVSQELPKNVKASSKNYSWKPSEKKSQDKVTAESMKETKKESEDKETHHKRPYHRRKTESDSSNTDKSSIQKPVETKEEEGGKE